MKDSDIKLQRKELFDPMTEILSFDPYTSCFYDITPRVQALSRSDRKRLVSLCRKILDDVNLRRNDDVRFVAVEVLVALVPDSADTIKRYINAKNDRYDYEIHHSLFCFLDEVPDLPGGKEFAKEIPSLIEKYLMEIRNDTAHVAFWAAILLEDYRDIEVSLPILIRLATSARFATSRKWSIYSLESVLMRLNNPHREKSIITLLRKISRSDRSKRVRFAACVVIDSYKHRDVSEDAPD